MQNKWDSELISETIKEYVAKQKIDTVSYFFFTYGFGKKLKGVFDRLLHLMDTVYPDTLIIFQVITEQSKFFFGGTIKIDGLNDNQKKKTLREYEPKHQIISTCIDSVST